MDFEVHFPGGILKNVVDSILFLSGDGNGVALQRMYQTIIINMGPRFRVSGIYATPPQPNEQTDTIWINGKQELPFMLEHSEGNIQPAGAVICLPHCSDKLPPDRKIPDQPAVAKRLFQAG